MERLKANPGFHALRPPVSAGFLLLIPVQVTGITASPAITSSVPGVGNGGALYLGLWNSNVTLYDTGFIGNNATGSGGAVEVLSIDSNVTFINTIASGNLAGQVKLNSPQAASQAVRSEGGVVHVQGSMGQLRLVNVNMTANRAGRVSCHQLCMHASRFQQHSLQQQSPSCAGAMEK